MYQDILLTMPRSVDSIHEIKNLKVFLEESLGTEILDCSSLNYMMNSGENFGSIIQSITVKVLNNDSDNNIKVIFIKFILIDLKIKFLFIYLFLAK